MLTDFATFPLTFQSYDIGRKGDSRHQCSLSTDVLSQIRTGAISPEVQRDKKVLGTEKKKRKDLTVGSENLTKLKKEKKHISSSDDGSGAVATTKRSQKDHGLRQTRKMIEISDTDSSECSRRRKQQTLERKKDRRLKGEPNPIALPKKKVSGSKSTKNSKNKQKSSNFFAMILSFLCRGNKGNKDKRAISKRNKDNHEAGRESRKGKIDTKDKHRKGETSSSTSTSKMNGEKLGHGKTHRHKGNIGETNSCTGKNNSKGAMDRGRANVDVKKNKKQKSCEEEKRRMKDHQQKSRLRSYYQTSDNDSSGHSSNFEEKVITTKSKRLQNDDTISRDSGQINQVNRSKHLPPPPPPPPPRRPRNSMSIDTGAKEKVYSNGDTKYQERKVRKIEPNINKSHEMKIPPSSSDDLHQLKKPIDLLSQIRAGTELKKAPQLNIDHDTLPSSKPESILSQIKAGTELKKTSKHKSENNSRSSDKPLSLLSEIRAGKKLKPQPQQNSQQERRRADEPVSLLSQIQQGKQLKHVSQRNMHECDEEGTKSLGKCSFLNKIAFETI